MNIIYRDNKEIKYESKWRTTKDDKTKDSYGKLYPWPKEGKYWQGSEQFINILKLLEEYLHDKNKFFEYDKHKSCILCGQPNITTGLFQLIDVSWEDGLIHYISKHNIHPTSTFIDTVYKFHPATGNRNKSRIVSFKGSDYIKGTTRYIKLDRNQILIMDALMRHGGYTKKYMDKRNKKIYRFSEHAGLLDFDNSGLERILVSGNTSRVDKGDDEIFQPKEIKDALNYEYIFHTHPPTPKPGGRASLGILFEFPSISDIFHFLDHFNEGKTQGSIVITPEGLYNIRKLEADKKKIKLDEEELYDDLLDIFRKVQHDAVKKYGDKFTTFMFYSKISQDKSYIDQINKVLNKYDLQIDYYSRVKDNKGRWIIDTIYLPIQIIQSKQ